MDAKPEKKSLFKVPKFKFGTATKLEDFTKEGFTVFSLAPVYVYASVRESLTDRFALTENIEFPKEMYSTTLHFDRPVVTRCEEWNYILYVMDNPTYKAFKSWLVNLQLVDRKERKYFRVRHYFAPVLDPVYLDTKGLALPTSLEIFSVSGIKSSIRPVTYLKSHEAAKDHIELIRVPPEEDVIIEAKSAFTFVENT